MPTGGVSLGPLRGRSLGGNRDVDSRSLGGFSLLFLDSGVVSRQIGLFSDRWGAAVTVFGFLSRLFFLNRFGLTHRFRLSQPGSGTGLTSNPLSNIWSFGCLPGAGLAMAVADFRERKKMIGCQSSPFQRLLASSVQRLISKSTWIGPYFFRACLPFVQTPSWFTLPGSIYRGRSYIW